MKWKTVSMTVAQILNSFIFLLNVNFYVMFSTESLSMTVGPTFQLKVAHRIERKLVAFLRASSWAFKFVNIWQLTLSRYEFGSSHLYPSLLILVGALTWTLKPEFHFFSYRNEAFLYHVGFQMCRAILNLDCSVQIYSLKCCVMLCVTRLPTNNFSDQIFFEWVRRALGVVH